MKPEQLEIARLKREVIKLKAERDILKKAAAYFAKESIPGPCFAIALLAKLTRYLRRRGQSHRPAPRARKTHKAG